MVKIQPWPSGTGRNPYMLRFKRRKSGRRSGNRRIVFEIASNGKALRRNAKPRVALEIRRALHVYFVGKLEHRPK